MVNANFPCTADVQFFQSQQVLPAWARPFATRGTRPLPTRIDDVVNAHAGLRPTAGELAASNLLAIVRSWRSRDADLLRELRELVPHPQCAVHPEKRAAFARRWAERLVAS